jgi:hypothetical protein
LADPQPETSIAIPTAIAVDAAPALVQTPRRVISSTTLFIVVYG